MNHTSRPPFALNRVFKSAKLAGTDSDDLAALEKSFRRSAFAFLPSAATPSRTPSNTLIASSRALAFEAPVYFRIPFGKDKWPEIVDWYINYGSKGSTAIDKMQLRKDRQQPYCHEYIVMFTRGGHVYRIDRRPDAGAAFDTIMKEGCTPYDTVEEVHSNLLKGLNGISDCVVELHWRTEKTIDLLFVLSICFRLHNDKSAQRYTLQHYNCYFLSWTIIMIIARNTTGCAAGLDAAIECGVWPKGLQNWNVELELDRARNNERILGLKLEQEREQAQIRKLKLELVRVRVPKRERVRELRRELLDVERARERMQELTQEREWELKRARALEREREQEWKRVRVLAQVVAQVPVVLGWQLAQGWKREEENVREKLRELLRAVDTGFLPGELDTMVKTVPNRLARLQGSHFHPI
jgi:hypothetical protein